MKKVAFITPTFPVLSETFIQTEIDSVKECGHEVCVLTFERETSELHFDYDIEQIGTSVAWKHLLHFKAQDIQKAISFVSDQTAMPKRSLFYFSTKLALQLKEQNVEHVHAHFCQHTAAHAIVASKLLGIGCSFVGHGHDVYEFAFDIDKKIRFSDFVVAVCQDMHDDFRKIFPGNIKLLHCGVKSEQYIPLNKKETGSIRLVFVGRLVITKGVHHLLEAMSLIDSSIDVTLDIIGDGEERLALYKQMERLELENQVQFLGAKPHQWVKNNLVNYDCMVAPFCFSDSGCVDTGPLVLKEAMASGTPVITSNIMGCKEIVAHGTGYLVDEKSPEQLAAKIIEFSNLPITQRNTIGQNARRRVVEHFNALTQAKQLSGWIEQVQKG
ncbi:glycosyltransferase family 4 protein [Vibrio sp. ZSDE26]|uniref:Glycosyltransferase family 4 protein n=1 Tax=Vibrio amylolyticus TaxID=2847292 RepID=A0A9X1XJU7_9VIBR|nr:glycosyltransferase family 4 protein [Vibrio amylolyticus]MCK6264076.1 glycosyltransferase family 4 protein [Vibrio amylolyticus]